MMDQQLKAIYYTALVNRDKNYVGKFIATVKTTGIYCIASCSARKPKFENVEFLQSVDEAKEAGYRACKICKP